MRRKEKEDVRKKKIRNEKKENRKMSERRRNEKKVVILGKDRWAIVDRNIYLVTVT